jgi:hypothetical protein
LAGHEIGYYRSPLLSAVERIPPLRHVFVFNGLDSFLKHFLRIPNNLVLRKRGILMAGKFSIYKCGKPEGKGWRYARAAYHPNGKIKPDALLVKGVNGKNVEEKHPEGFYFLNFNNRWIRVREDALEARDFATLNWPTSRI